ncbi:hypothetical protein PtB15_18B339 [Puccinia triticina]|nr:hypothetical protein PtB15_18B339 [Puccinia triticina]
MSTTDLPSADQPGSAPPPWAQDKEWISSLVDCLVPKFQAVPASSGGDAAMQSDTEGK